MDHHFTSLVKEYGPRVYRQAFGMLGNRADAEEAAQDVVMIIHGKLATFRGESSVRLAELIALLPAHEAAAISLFYMDELSYDEIGKVLEIPPGTVATTLHRGRRHLHALLTSQDRD